MASTARNDFGTFVENFERFYGVGQVVCESGRRFKYVFMDPSGFVRLMKRSFAAGNQIYAQELLFRAHWAALTTILRNQRWMHGMDMALKDPNYFAFCACLRGLVESAADSYEALRFVADAFGEHFGSLRTALERRFADGVVHAEQIEDSLLHYTHGRRLESGAIVPQTHKAKTIQEYIATLEETGSSSVRDLYAELCGITHPSAATTHFFIRNNPKKPVDYELVERDNDMPDIVSLFTRHDPVWPSVFQKSFNSALLTLWVVNRFEDKRVFTPGVDELDFSALPWFPRLRDRICASRP